MITIGTVLIALLLFTAGGIVKGLLGVGLPMVAIPGLTLIVGLPNALAMVSVPVALANLWQVWQFRQAPGPGGVLVPYLISGAIGTIIGTLILVSLPEAWLELGLATMLIGYVVLRLSNPGLKLMQGAARKSAAPVGFGAGVLHGSTGIAGPIGITYFHAQGLSRDRFILSVGLMFLTFAAVQIPMLGLAGILRADTVLTGVIGLPAVAAGLWIGNMLGRRIEPKVFDWLVLIVLTWTAAGLAWRSVSEFAGV